MLIVFTTAPTAEEADKLAKGIVESKLAACVQVLPEMRSHYSWKGEVVSEPEHLLLIKTIDEKFEELEAYLLEKHSYETPEIVAVEASKVSEGYLNWLEEYLLIGQ
jgi:periplasmic divalent cation tolerance protein